MVGVHTFRVITAMKHELSFGNSPFVKCVRVLMGSDLRVLWTGQMDHAIPSIVKSCYPFPAAAFLHRITSMEMIRHIWRLLLQERPRALRLLVMSCTQLTTNRFPAAEFAVNSNVLVCHEEYL